MIYKQLYSASFFLKAIFVVSLFVLVFLAGITYKHNLSLADSTEAVVHSYKVNVQLEQMFSYLKDAETEQRGYVITRDSVFLKHFDSSQKNAHKAFDELKTLTADNVWQLNNLDSLSKLINLRFSSLATNLILIEQNSFNKTLLNSSMLRGKVIMDMIRLQINEIIDLEMEYLSQRQSKYENEIYFTPFFTLLTFLFALLVFIFSFWKINNDLHFLRKSNASLLLTTAAIKQAEEIGAFSSWQWNLQTNKLIYSDNQYLLLGCEPKSFEPSVEKFLEFVHHKDRHIVTDGANQVMNNNRYPAAFFRVIRKDGELRYWKSLSKLIIDANGNKTLIGINSDITEQHLNKLSLEERNRELELSNKELASFNHVASHDLQEPLRIIQTYISRINEKEASALSEKGKDYFSRIMIAIARMRSLIDALLLFSRTNKAEKVFERSDLNELLENSKQDLAQFIEEKKVIIESVELPTMKVIPFQIQQLFTNLIGNSIKYSKENVSPVIKIDCEKADDSEVEEYLSGKAKSYCKISISDNGLGFEQQYAESIFNLFQRLHPDSKYTGTGIGLSICKKIVENHGGFIKAEGRPNEGATFFIFLPS